MVDPAGRDEVEVASAVHGIVEEQPRADSVRINQVLAQNRRAGLISREIHVDVRVGRELDAGSSLIVVRVEVLVDSARALLLRVPESDRKAAGGLVIEVADGVKVTISVKVRAGEMPPENIKKRPSKSEQELLAGWTRDTLDKFYKSSPPDPGRVTVRRLNRTEYNNVVRDLMYVDFEPANDFPADDSGHGFDNIGDVLTVSPLLLEKYINAAEKIASKVIV